ncbi:unspecified product [Leishmania tarentolae]|uniref:Unspecified product n=1 Tax=Leishmania tarentolae TaxID=5689 RepID=A0A640KNB7_LEITA|nr:unspecified product [Leishmania tarentolae]
MELAAEATSIKDVFPHFNFTADTAASTVLRQATDAFSMENTEEVVRLVRQLLEKVLQTESSGTVAWTQVYVFGSSGLGAAITGSDIDLYGEPLPFPTPRFFSPFARNFPSPLPPPSPTYRLRLCPIPLSIFPSPLFTPLSCAHPPSTVVGGACEAPQLQVCAPEQERGEGRAAVWTRVECLCCACMLGSVCGMPVSLSLSVSFSSLHFHWSLLLPFSLGFPKCLLTHCACEWQ